MKVNHSQKFQKLFSTAYFVHKIEWKKKNKKKKTLTSLINLINIALFVNFVLTIISELFVDKRS